MTWIMPLVLIGFITETQIEVILIRTTILTDSTISMVSIILECLMALTIHSVASVALEVSVDLEVLEDLEVSA